MMKHDIKEKNLKKLNFCFVENLVEKSCKHSETGITLLMWPWPAKIAGQDLNLSDPREPGLMTLLPDN